MKNLTQAERREKVKKLIQRFKNRKLNDDDMTTFSPLFLPFWGIICVLLNSVVNIYSSRYALILLVLLLSGISILVASIFLMEKTPKNVAEVFGSFIALVFWFLTDTLYSKLGLWEPDIGTTNVPWLDMWHEPSTYVGFAVAGVAWWLTAKVVENYMKKNEKNIFNN
ncbi:hypothetical protein KJ633_01325 [bacterium]|nr:hypothetical protein [bacterium]